MLPDTMQTGIIITVALALVGIIGVLGNTQKYQGLKWALFFLLLAGAGMGINKEFQADAAAVAERKRSEEALKIANESSRMVENGILRQEESRAKFNEHRERLESDIQKQQLLLESLVGQIVGLSNKVEEMSDAAEKAKKKKEIAQIAQMGAEVRISAAKTLVSLAKKEGWLTDNEFKKMVVKLKKDKPLKAADLELVQKKMKRKHQESRK